MSLKYKALFRFYAGLWLGRRASRGELFDTFMLDFRQALPRDKDYAFLMTEAADLARHEGVMRHGSRLWESLSFQRGDSVLEMGPGHGLLALKAALGGLHVTLLEHPASPFLPFLQYFMSLLKKAIASRGGSIELMLADVLSETDRQKVAQRLQGRLFDHAVALDVFCCNGQTIKDVRSVARAFRWREASTEAYYGIYDAEKELAALTFLLRFKQAAGGRVYINHTYSWGRTMDQVQRGSFRGLKPFKPVAGLEKAFAAHGLRPRVKSYVPTTRNPVPCAALYELGRHAG